jgi:hypothetical protein
VADRGINSQDVGAELVFMCLLLLFWGGNGPLVGTRARARQGAGLDRSCLSFFGPDGLADPAGKCLQILHQSREKVKSRASLAAVNAVAVTG